MMPEQLLVCRIFEQAILDYKKLKEKHTSKIDERESGKYSINDIETFFNSEWCDGLLSMIHCNITGEDILRSIETQCA